MNRISSSDEDTTKDNKNGYTKTTKRIPKTSSYSLKSNLSKWSYQIKTNPQKTINRMAIKLAIYLWSVAVILSILSLIGFPISSFFTTAISDEQPQDKIDYAASRALRSTDDEDPSADQFLSWSAFSSHLFPSAVESEQEEDEDKKEEEYSESIPQQVLPAIPKQGNKLNKELEKKLACEELSCADSCAKKIKPKCAKSLSCRKEREKLCKRRCRKQRCEDRCKDEPKFGYVEREQRMEKCKDDCSGPTAVHNKCIKKCHSVFKPCKSRCHEVAGKYQCDVEQPLFSQVEEDESLTIDDGEDKEDIDVSPFDDLDDDEVI